MRLREHRLVPARCASALALLLLSIFVLLIGCAGSSPELPNAGKSLTLVSGMMIFDIECVPALTADGAVIDVYWGIPATSLSFERRGNSFRARYEVTLRLRDRDGGTVRQEQSRVETTSVATYSQTQRFDPVQGVRRLTVARGVWQIEVAIEDRNSGTSATRFQTVTPPDPGNLLPSLGKIVVESQQPSGEFSPFVFFHIPSSLDSLRATVQCFRLPNNVVPRVLWRFDRFEGDTATPPPPYVYGFESSVWFSKFREVKFENEDTLGRDTASVRATGIETHLFSGLPRISSGLSRVSVQVVIPSGAVDGTDTVLHASRVYSIKGPTFPRPSTLDELVDAMVYIATDDEMKRMRSAKNPVEKRERFDLFWLARTESREGAANLLKGYYTRVEEANRYFTTLNEGWRTDRGMLFILLGPPAEIDNSLDSQTWVYNYPGGREPNAFIFRKIVMEGEGVSLRDFRLYRDALYEGLWKRIVSRWREGYSY